MTRKVVVVTGASRGIGADAVTAFRRLDYRVVATSRSIEASDDEDVLAIAGDIGDPATARRVVSEGVARFGRIDTLVNNAGIYIGRPFTEHTAADYAAVMNVNMAGFFHVTQLAIAEMEKRSSGHVVTVTTSIDQVAISGVWSVLAAMSKGGLNAATRSLAIEYAKRGIRVNAVAPGNIKTTMHAPEHHEALGAFQPIGRMGETSDIVDAILFLDAAPFVTGEILHVDGGRVPAAERPVEVRPVDRGDFDAWLPLWQGYQRFYRMEIPAGVTLETWRRFLDPAEPMHAALAVTDGRALGMVHAVRHRSAWTTTDHCYLQDLFVAEGARGRSIGRALVEHVYADARQRGASRVYWVTHETNHEAMRLYDRIARRAPVVQYRCELEP